NSPIRELPPSHCEASMSKALFVSAIVLVGFSCGADPALAQTIERGKLKSLDVEKKLLVVTAEGKDRELSLTEETRVLDAEGKTLAEKLADFKAGADMQFVAVKRDGREFAQGLRLVR